MFERMCVGSLSLKGKNLRNVLGEFQMIMILELSKYFEAKLENRFLMTFEYLPKNAQEISFS